MTNQRESLRKAIYQKVGVDNCVLSVVSRVGECVLSSGFVYTLKCMSLVLVLGVCMKTVELKVLSLVCYVQQSAADRHADVSSWQPMSPSLLLSVIFPFCC